MESQDWEIGGKSCCCSGDDANELRNEVVCPAVLLPVVELLLLMLLFPVLVGCEEEDVCGCPAGELLPYISTGLPPDDAAGPAVVVVVGGGSG